MKTPKIIITLLLFLILFSQIPSTSAQTPYTTQNSWHTTTPPPQKLIHAKATTLHNNIYLFGGITHKGIWSHHVYRYNITTKTWHDETSLLQTRTNFGITTHNNTIYLIGGNSCGCTGEPATLNLVQTYNPKTKTWTTKSPMPTPRYGLTLTTHNNRIYAIGGFNNQHAPSYLNTTEIYHPHNNTWTTGPPMPTPRGYTTSTIHHNHLYLIGGSQSPLLLSTKNLNTVETLNLTTHQWSNKNPLPIPLSHLHTHNLNNNLYLYSGTPLNTTHNTLTYHTQTDTWNWITPLTPPRTYYAATTHNNQTYLINGYDYTSYYQTTTIFSPAPINHPPTITITNQTYNPNNHSIYIEGTAQDPENTLQTIHITTHNATTQIAHGTYNWSHTQRINYTSQEKNITLTAQSYDGTQYSQPIITTIPILKQTNTTETNSLPEISIIFLCITFLIATLIRSKIQKKY